MLLLFTKHSLFTSVLFSLTSDDKPSVESHFLFHSLPLFLLSFIPSALFHPSCCYIALPAFLPQWWVTFHTDMVLSFLTRKFIVV